MKPIHVIHALHELTPHISAVEPDACPELLAVLERLKAQTWARLLSLRQPRERVEEHELLDMKQVAKVLHIPKGRAYELARQGRLPVMRIGKYVRMSRKALTSYIGKLVSEPPSSLDVRRAAVLQSTPMTGEQFRKF